MKTATIREKAKKKVSQKRGGGQSRVGAEKDRLTCGKKKKRGSSIRKG